MKILLIHSYYQHRGGEDAVFEQEYELLRQSQEVKAVTFRNLTGWRGAFQFLFSIWNFRIAGQVKRIILQFKPDIVQIYNWHFATGPVIIRVARRFGAHIIINIANYRLLCPSATLVHNGKLFVASINKRGFPWEAVRSKVYRNSYFQTFWNAFIVYFHKKMGTWEQVDKYIVPTGIVKNLFTNHQSYIDIPADKIIVKPNFSESGSGIHVKRGRQFLFIGRLSEEKGIRVLLDAFENSPYELVIAGTGPFMQTVVETCSRFSNIKYVGQQDKEAVTQAMNSCTALIFPSICYETFGLVISEAYANGCPVIASDIGSPAEIVVNGITGLHFITGSKESLQKQLRFWLDQSDSVMENYRMNCIATYRNLYTPEGNRKQLMDIYHSIMN